LYIGSGGLRGFSASLVWRGKSRVTLSALPDFAKSSLSLRNQFSQYLSGAPVNFGSDQGSIALQLPTELGRFSFHAGNRNTTERGAP
jgi:hypothetical protein